MSEEVFPLESSKYKVHKIIGRGATAVVFYATCLTNDVDVALKIIDLEQCPIEIEALRNEIAFWSSCDHPNLVKYYASFIERSYLYIVMEYMDEGSMYEILRFGFNRGLPRENIIAAILKHLLNALDYFHSNQQIHRDIKAGNILINKKGEVKLGDFGIAAKLIENGQRIRARFTVIGTPCYMAPEVLCAGIGYTEKADIWSLGITAIELAKGSAPFSNLYPLEVVIRVANSPPPTLSDFFSFAFRDFVKSCLQTDPDKRLTAKELLAHRFIKQAATDNELLEMFSSIPPISEQYEIVHKSRKLKRSAIIEEVIKHGNNDDDANFLPNQTSDTEGGIKKKENDDTEWNFSDVTEKNDPNSVDNALSKSISNSSISSYISDDENLIKRVLSHESSDTVIHKGKFTITKRSLQNLPSDSAIVEMMNSKISSIKMRIEQLKVENKSLNEKIDTLFNHLAALL